MRRRGYFRKDEIRKGIYIVPNSITAMNLFCGFYAILAAISYDFILAANFVILAAILDTLDGRIARLTRTTSKFGSEFDSLADVVSFGVAPAILAYTWALGTYGKLGWLVAFLYVACGALRLARFNVQLGQIDSKYFKGLPIPGAAIVIATAVHFHHYLTGAGDVQSLVVLTMLAVLPLLMVSTIRYYSFKDLNYFARKPLMSLVLVVFTMAVIVAEPQIMLFSFAFSYSLSGPVWWVANVLRRGKDAKHQEVGLNPTE